MPDSGSLLHRRRHVRDEIARLRFQARWHVGMGVLWAGLAAAAWLDDSSADWVRWGWSVLALVSLALGLTWERAFRRERHRLAGLVGLDLQPVAETTLSRLVVAALEGAAADEVTPRAAPAEGWTPERVEWFRAFHRDRRSGLDGPTDEATWAVVEVVGQGRDGERVVGSVRLRRTAEPGVLEAGIWLVRDARGRGVGQQALLLVLDRAREAGARTITAEMTAGSEGAVALRSLGFAPAVDGDRVRGELRLPQ